MFNPKKAVLVFQQSTLMALLAVQFISCTPEGLQNGNRKQYFDLTGFISDITADSQVIKVEKRVAIGDSDETKILENYELWKDELSFDNFDINRPALIDKYQVDTVTDNNTLTELYQALDPELRVQEMKVVHQGQTVTDIMVRAHSESFLEDLDIELHWSPGSGYVYRKLSDKIFSDLQEQKVSVVASPD